MSPDPPTRLIQTLAKRLPDHARSRRILEEIGAHLQDCVALLVQQGLGPEEAHAEAVRRFGDPEIVAGRVREIIAMEEEAFRRRLALLAVTPSVVIACLFAVTMTVMSLYVHPHPAYLAVVAFGAVVVLGAGSLCARQVFSPRAERGRRASRLRLAAVAAGVVGVAVCVDAAIRALTTGDADGYAAIGGVGILATAITGFLLAEYDAVLAGP